MVDLGAVAREGFEDGDSWEEIASAVIEAMRNQYADASGEELALFDEGAAEIQRLAEDLASWNDIRSELLAEISCPASPLHGTEAAELVRRLIAATERIVGLEEV
jgi:hypothetical protein